jgi:single-stranded-DNA-specific exonuclease
MAQPQPLADPAADPLSPRWLLRAPAPPAEVARLCRELGLPPVLASLLWARGFTEGASEALHPPLRPSAIPSLDEAAQRLEAALKNGKRILLHGDYDADGITGTAVLTLGLRALGGRVTPFIPNRLEDGYGIHPDRVAEHAATADLFVTIDCGISNLAEVAALQEAGVEVIVSDHHSPGEKLPGCLVVHPKLAGAAEAPALTGSGVAYHLLWALHRRLGLEAPLDYSDLATIGTIADVAPLLGENRALALEGLKRLACSRWPGVRACVSRSLAGRAPTARDVAFVIAPRLNAAGRLGEAELGLELLTTASERRGRELAAYLDARNLDRRKVQDEMLEEALKLVDPSAPALVLDSPGWHPGVMGIVASKLLERFYKPVFIMAQGKGSVRSTPGISAVGALDSAQDHLTRYGGHLQAAGFTLEEGKLGAFREAVCAYVGRFEPAQPSVLIDALLQPEDITADLLAAIARLEPCGEGHAAPRFALTGAPVSARAVGQGGRHLQLRLPSIKGVAWSQGALAPRYSGGGKIDAAVSLRENEWNGKTTIEFVAEVLRPAEPFGWSGLAGKEGSWPEGISGAEVRRLPAGDPPSASYPGLHLYGKDRYAKERYAKDWSEQLPRWEPGEPAPPALLLTELPLHPGALRACEALETLVSESTRLLFALDAAALAAVGERLAAYPSLGDLRLAFSHLRAGRDLPFGESKRALCRRALVELGLVDEAGRARRGERRDPYASPTFLGGQIVRYRLRHFLDAFEQADDASFARAVQVMFATPAPAPSAQDGHAGA